MAAEEKPDIKQTRAELTVWVSALDQAIADLRRTIDQESEKHR